ncbi:hypothetical protein U8P68_10760 [Rhizobium ruizarguesonis]|jgi:hypothetical protein|uniref:hypothetical protein n=1 Tax=Rhizobium leguminosarum TaxID=384 RepID=UPI00103014D0|nr:hypothetical protein [Rhizobium leguminosarum]TBE54446.1 hypothetical protein ELH04_08510 [Rhizobium leguminosarum]WSH59799.1 hypothetical protein U8P68_10760 [Rhizobium ruizarguesonis]
MQPEIDRARLARDVRVWLFDKHLTTRSAPQIHAGLNPAMISRACRESVLSAASMLALCAAMKRDPTTYLIFLDKRNQAVTANVRRETRGAP